MEETVLESQEVEMLAVEAQECVMNFRGVVAHEGIRAGMHTLLKVIPEAGEAVFHSRALTMGLRGQQRASRRCTGRSRGG